MHAEGWCKNNVHCCINFRCVTWSVARQLKTQQTPNAASANTAASMSTSTPTQTDSELAVHLSDSCVQVQNSCFFCASTFLGSEEQISA